MNLRIDVVGLVWPLFMKYPGPWFSVVIMERNEAYSIGSITIRTPTLAR